MPSPTSSAGTGGSAEEDPFGSAPLRRANFFAWVFYQSFYRIGWQFKMEATMMAGLVSYLAPSPTVMGMFTALNGAGRNLAPLFAAPIVDRFRSKRNALLLFWVATVAIWALLTVYLWTPSAMNPHVALWVFGVCYTLFFVFLGAVTVAQGAVLGKIIPADMRGKSLAMGMSLSGLVNVGGVLLIYRLVQHGGFPEPKNYALSFTCTTVLFLMAGVALLWVKEPDTNSPVRRHSLAGSLRYFVALARGNQDLARLMAVNAAVNVLGGMLQFYTGYWRTHGTMTPGALVMATVFQVFWQSLSSSILGGMADRRGNRVLICVLLWMEAAVPLTAWVLGGWEPFRSNWFWFLGVYTLIGLRFPLYQFLTNYLLEIVEQKDHAMALGAVNTVGLLTVPIPLILGELARHFGYPVIFVLGAVIGLFGAATARGLREVRVGVA